MDSMASLSRLRDRECERVLADLFLRNGPRSIVSRARRAIDELRCCPLTPSRGFTSSAMTSRRRAFYLRAGHRFAIRPTTLKPYASSKSASISRSRSASTSALRGTRTSSPRRVRENARAIPRAALLHDRIDVSLDEAARDRARS